MTDADTEFGTIDYTRIDVDKTASYASLEGRVVIVTGGGQGIGRGYAHYFAAQGAIPVIAELDGENASACGRRNRGRTTARRLPCKPMSATRSRSRRWRRRRSMRSGGSTS